MLDSVSLRRPRPDSAFIHHLLKLVALSTTSISPNPKTSQPITFQHLTKIIRCDVNYSILREFNSPTEYTIHLLATQRVVDHRITHVGEESTTTRLDGLLHQIQVFT